MLNFILPEDGSLEAQEMQYLRVKRGSNLALEMRFYKDRFKIYPWNLENPVQFNVRGKKLKDLHQYVFNKDKDSLDIALTDADVGIVTVVLNSTDEAASITGDNSDFTGGAGDLIKITLDSIVYDNINLATCVSIEDVADAINAAVGEYIATVSIGGFLVLTSNISNDNSNITIADGSKAIQTVVGELFDTATRTDTGRYGDLSIAQSLYLEVEFQPNASDRVYKTADAIIDVTKSVET